MTALGGLILIILLFVILNNIRKAFDPRADRNGRSVFSGGADTSPASYSGVNPPDQYFYDAGGRVLGRRQYLHPRINLFDVGGRYLGYYNRDSNTTFDAGGRVIGYGDILNTLL